MKFSRILIRYGEIALKSKQVRKRMEEKLQRNLQKHLSHLKISFKIKRLPLQGRLFIEAPELQPILDVLHHVLGVVSFSPCFQTSINMDDIKEAGLRIARSILNQDESFAIRVRRSGTHDFSSQEVARILGEHVLSNLKNLNIRVDLSNPQKTIHVEIRDQSTYLFHEIFRGIGGFPFGVQSDLIAIIHDDMEDSLISSFLMMRKGCRVFPLICEDDLSLWEQYLACLKKFIPSNELTCHVISTPSEFNVILPKDKLALLVKQAEQLIDSINATGIVIPLNLSGNVNEQLEIVSFINQEKKSPRFFPLLGVTDAIREIVRSILKLPKEKIGLTSGQTRDLIVNKSKKGKISEIPLRIKKLVL
ncbi:MAG: THUMP domain-containing protein [Candidatus Helarchaeota archaeon]